MYKKLILVLLVGLVSSGCVSPLRKGKAMNSTVVIETSMGTMKAELWADKAPKSVENFLQYPPVQPQKMSTLVSPHLVITFIHILHQK
jgi:hypothetical protein